MGNSTVAIVHNLLDLKFFILKTLNTTFYFIIFTYQQYPTKWGYNLDQLQLCCMHDCRKLLEYTPEKNKIIQDKYCLKSIGFCRIFVTHHRKFILGISYEKASYIWRFYIKIWSLWKIFITLFIIELKHTFSYHSVSDTAYFHVLHYHL